MKKKIIFFLFITFFLFFATMNLQASNIKFVSTKAGLNLRTSPNKSANAVELLPYGVTVSIVKETGNETFINGRYGKWVNIKAGNKTGWVFSGFLCDFKPDSIIKLAADYYRKKYSEDEYLKRYDEYIKFSDDKVSVVEIIDNFIVLEIPTTSSLSPEIDSGNAIWKYDIKCKKFNEVYSLSQSNTMKLLYLDNDKYSDLVLTQGCCNTVTVNILLGTHNGFIPFYEKKSSAMGYGFIPGRCDEAVLILGDEINETEVLKIAQRDVTISYYTPVKNYHRYNCSKKVFEIFEQGKIYRNDGQITDLDIKKKSITIKDDFYDKIIDYSLSERAIKENSVSDFKIGDKITYEYEALNGRNIIFELSPKSYYSSFKKEGLVIAFDPETKMLALKYKKENHVYKINDKVQFINSYNRSINDLKENEEIEIAYEKGIMSSITSYGVAFEGKIINFDKKNMAVTIKSYAGDEQELVVDESSLTNFRKKKIDISEIKEGIMMKGHYIEKNNLKLIKSLILYDF